MDALEEIDESEDPAPLSSSPAVAATHQFPASFATWRWSFATM